MLSIVVLYLLLGTAPPAPDPADGARMAVPDSPRILFDFERTEEVEPWWPLDDRVMGGISRSRFVRGDKGVAVFEGNVSLEQNGGFASVRSATGRWETAGAEAFVLRVKGDGKTYRLALRTDTASDGVLYQASFPTKSGEWREVALPLSEFRASRHGDPVPDAPPLDPAKIRTFGFLIADRQDGLFRLEVDWIGARPGSAGPHGDAPGETSKPAADAPAGRNG